MRPIDQTAGDRRAVMWKNDDYAKTFDRLQVSRDLHRYAGKAHGLSCIPKRSAIDGRYFAEINRYAGQGTMHMNVALGTGADPVEAAINGYRRASPHLIWSVFEMELECERMRRAIEARAMLELRLDQTLDGLTTLIRSYTVPLLAIPGEDDDL